MAVYQLIRVEFDWLENRESDALCPKVLGTFVDGPDGTAYKKIDDLLRALEPAKPYLGHNWQVYPQYRIERIVVK